MITQALPETGQLIIIGDNPADVAAVIQIIRFLELTAAGSEVEIQMVPLQMGDATAISLYLTEFYRRVIVTASGSRISAAPARTTQAVPFAGVVTQENTSSVVLLPYPRFNAILVAAPKARHEGCDRTGQGA